MKDILLFIWGRILGYEYSCDRCSSLGHTYMTLGIIDYIRNKNQNGRYCKWCWSYIHLKHFDCKCGNTMTLRSSHQTLLTCPSCYSLNHSKTYIPKLGRL